MSQVEDLEEQLQSNAKLIKLGDALERLARNPDFKEAIIEQFTVKDCARYTRESVDPALSAEDRADALSFAQAAGHLRHWLMVQLRLAANAKAQMVELEEAIAEVRASEDAGE